MEDETQLYTWRTRRSGTWWRYLQAGDSAASVTRKNVMSSAESASSRMTPLSTAKGSPTVPDDIRRALLTDPAVRYRQPHSGGPWELDDTPSTTPLTWSSVYIPGAVEAPGWSKASDAAQVQAVDALRDTHPSFIGAFAPGNTIWRATGDSGTTYTVGRTRRIGSVSPGRWQLYVERFPIAAYAHLSPLKYVASVIEDAGTDYPRVEDADLSMFDIPTMMDLAGTARSLGTTGYTTPNGISKGDIVFRIKDAPPKPLRVTAIDAHDWRLIFTSPTAEQSTDLVGENYARFRLATGYALPVFRNATQREVLLALYSQPSTEQTITEVAARAGAPLTSTHREVTRLLAAKMLIERRQGTNRLIRVNAEHPATAAITTLVSLNIGSASDT